MSAFRLDMDPELLGCDLSPLSGFELRACAGREAPAAVFDSEQVECLAPSQVLARGESGTDVAMKSEVLASREHACPADTGEESDLSAMPCILVKKICSVQIDTQDPSDASSGENARCPDSPTASANCNYDADCMYPEEPRDAAAFEHYAAAASVDACRPHNKIAGSMLGSLPLFTGKVSRKIQGRSSVALAEPAMNEQRASAEPARTVTKSIRQSMKAVGGNAATSTQRAMQSTTSAVISANRAVVKGLTATLTKRPLEQRDR